MLNSCKMNGVTSVAANSRAHNLGGCTPSYILDTRAFGTYLLGGLFTLQKRL